MRAPRHAAGAGTGTGRTPCTSPQPAPVASPPSAVDRPRCTRRSRGADHAGAASRLRQRQGIADVRRERSRIAAGRTSRGPPSAPDGGRPDPPRIRGSRGTGRVSRGAECVRVGFRFGERARTDPPRVRRNRRTGRIRPDGRGDGRVGSRFRIDERARADPPRVRGSRGTGGVRGDSRGAAHVGVGFRPSERDRPDPPRVRAATSAARVDRGGRFANRLGGGGRRRSIPAGHDGRRHRRRHDAGLPNRGRSVGRLVRCDRTDRSAGHAPAVCGTAAGREAIVLADGSGADGVRVREVTAEQAHPTLRAPPRLRRGATIAAVVTRVDRLTRAS